MKSSRALVVALMTTCALVASAAIALAYITHDVSGVKLNDSSFKLFGSSAYHISSGTDGDVSFRWLDASGKDTVIRALNCDGSFEYGRSTISAGDTTYHQLFNGGANTCFELSGKVVSGQGDMANGHDGRVQH